MEYRMLLEKSKRNERRRRNRRRRDFNIEMNLKRIGWEGITASHLAQDTDICCSLQRENSRLAQKLPASKEGPFSMDIFS
jgi:hypothetical protein